MEIRKRVPACSEAREMDMVDYLAAAGHEPKKIRNNDYWYLSPLRIEKTPSFKVNRKLNRWYDHGIGKGGNLIDFAVLYHNYTIGEFLQSLQGYLSFHKQTSLFPPTDVNVSNTQIKILNSKPLHSPVLIRYLHSRKIPFALAEKYCSEVNFELNGKSYYSIGLLNDSGGYELRNSYWKNSSSPKDITTIKNGTEKIAVFEGFFDFLSFLVLCQNQEPFDWDFCSLNSLSFFEKARPFLERYRSIHLFLDNDKAGQNCSRYALELDKKYKDESRMYQGYKDLNDWIMSMGKEPKSSVDGVPP